MSLKDTPMIGKKLTDSGAELKFEHYTHSPSNMDDGGYIRFGESADIKGSTTNEVMEVPFMAGTTLDQFVGSKPRHLQSSRLKIRHNVGMEDIRRHVMGSRGSFTIDSSFVLL